MACSRIITNILNNSDRVCCEYMNIEITISTVEAVNDIGVFQCQKCDLVGQYRVTDGHTKVWWIGEMIMTRNIQRSLFQEVQRRTAISRRRDNDA